MDGWEEKPSKNATTIRPRCVLMALTVCVVLGLIIDRRKQDVYLSCPVSSCLY